MGRGDAQCVLSGGPRSASPRRPASPAQGESERLYLRQARTKALQMNWLNRDRPTHTNLPFPDDAGARIERRHCLALHEAIAWWQESATRGRANGQREDRSGHPRERTIAGRSFRWRSHSPIPAACSGECEAARSDEAPNTTTVGIQGPIRVPEGATFDGTSSRDACCP